MNKKLIEALREIEKEKGIKMDTVVDALKVALSAAYNKLYSIDDNIRIDINENNGEIRVFKIVDDAAPDENEPGTPQKSEKITDDLAPDVTGEITEIEVTPGDFGRITAQTVKQVIRQRIKEAEREIMYEDFKDRMGDLVTGIVQQNDSRFTLVDLGKVEALLPQYEQVHGEAYNHGERIKCYISEVRKTTKGPQVIVSRTHTGLVKKLFELEVPEISEKIVEIKSIAREAGHRTKIAVASNDSNVDPVGACVGPKGSRVRMIVDELEGEKIDIVNYSDDPVVFIKNALSPARVLKVLIDDEKNFALIVVPNDQLSLAIGREGQNARLAAKLTGWKIDIKSEKQFEEELDIAREERIKRDEVLKDGDENKE